MTQEEKRLLLVDLCARLRYGVKVDLFGQSKELIGVLNDIISVGYDINDYDDAPIEDVKPYLRPLSSMTEEEDEWLNDRINFSRDDEVDKVRQKWGIVIQEIYTNSSKYVFSNFTEILDWLNEHHFDYRGLIEKGLALEAPEDMYK